MSYIVLYNNHPYIFGAMFLKKGDFFFPFSSTLGSMLYMHNIEFNFNKCQDIPEFEAGSSHNTWIL
jgi:hypothetical protein